MINSESNIVSKLDRLKQMLEGKRDMENLKNKQKQSTDKFHEINAIITQDSQAKTIFPSDAPKLFVENKVKHGQDHGGETCERERDGSYYITALNTKRNPDLLIPGGALKGNMYFRKTIT